VYIFEYILMYDLCPINYTIKSLDATKVQYKYYNATERPPRVLKQGCGTKLFSWLTVILVCLQSEIVSKKEASTYSHLVPILSRVSFIKYA